VQNMEKKNLLVCPLQRCAFNFFVPIVFVDNKFVQSLILFIITLCNNSPDCPVYGVPELCSCREMSRRMHGFACHKTAMPCTISLQAAVHPVHIC
jgi:hypothetical protein